MIIAVTTRKQTLLFNLSLPIPDPENPPVLKFPPRCVHCGQPTQETLPVKMPMGVEKRSSPVMLEFALPMYTEGARAVLEINTPASVKILWFVLVIVNLMLCGTAGSLIVFLR